MSESVEFEKMVRSVYKDLLKTLIYTNESGDFILFEKYVIHKRKGHYEVEKTNVAHQLQFTSVKNAATWAILDHHNKIVEAKRVCELDAALTSILVDKGIHMKLQSSGSLESREINRDKFLHDVHRQNRFRQELDKYIIMAKSCQERGFKHELTRTAQHQKN
jgi:hypothetical protein